MRIARMTAALALVGAALLGPAGPALADGPSASPSAGGTDAPADAGTSFRTATEIEQGTRASAEASTGDYLYWVFAADAGQRPTVEATVTLPGSAARQATWQIDVYDGLRRRQACMYGHQTRQAASGARTVELDCVLRPVRGWADPWANDPLPGAYYVRLTTVDLREADLGQPVRAEVEVNSKDVGGSHAVDGSLGDPLVLRATVGEEGSDERVPTVAAPGDGWSSGWWSDRWLWTAGGGVLGALAAIGGYRLTRGPGRGPGQAPPGA